MVQPVFCSAKRLILSNNISPIWDISRPISCRVVPPESKVLHMGKSFFSWSVPFRVVVQGRQGRLLFLTFTTLTNDIGLLRITSGAYQLGLGVGGAHVIRALGVEIYLRPLSL